METTLYVSSADGVIVGSVDVPYCSYCLCLVMADHDCRGDDDK